MGYSRRGWLRAGGAMGAGGLLEGGPVVEFRPDYLQPDGQSRLLAAELGGFVAPPGYAD